MFKALRQNFSSETMKFIVVSQCIPFGLLLVLGITQTIARSMFYVFFFSLARKRNTSVKNESLVPIQIMIIDWNLVERGDFLARHLLETTASQNHVLLRHNRHANIRRA